MPDRFYGIDKGEQGPRDVLVQATTTSRNVELRVSDVNLPVGAQDKRLFIATAVEAILQRLEQDAV